MIVIRVSADAGQVNGVDVDDMGTWDLQVRERDAHFISRYTELSAE